jgi:hypothetical protein
VSFIRESDVLGNRSYFEAEALSSSPHAHSFVIGPAVINTHRRRIILKQRPNIVVREL